MEKEILIKKKNDLIILEVALQMNEEFYKEKKINYKTYKYAEENILKKIKNKN